jgi:hypothetical protein
VNKPLGVVALDLDLRKADGTICVQGKSTCAFKGAAKSALQKA